MTGIVCVLIFILTIFDVVCTGWGVTSGYINELNPIVAWFFRWNVWGTCAIALVATGGLLYLVYSLKIEWAFYAMLVVLLMKIVAIGMHIYWITQLIRSST
jgi:hypothetical protein